MMMESSEHLIMRLYHHLVVGFHYSTKMRPYRVECTLHLRKARLPFRAA